MGFKSVGVALAVNHFFDAAAAAGGDQSRPTLLASDPPFRLVVSLEKFIRDTHGWRKLVYRKTKSHVSTITEFLSLSESLPASCNLMAAMSFPDIHLLSDENLGPSIMRYALEEAKEGARLMGLTGLQVTASVMVHEYPLFRDTAEGAEGAEVEVIPTSTPNKLVYPSASTIYFLELLRCGDGHVGANYGCTVCLAEKFRSDEKVVRLPCGHVFHRHCVVNWMHRRSSCPLCHFSLP